MGAGATAEVFLAAGPNPRGAELVALKIVLPHLAEDEDLRGMLLREARTSSLLRHPNLVEIYEVGELEGRPYLAMEFVAGWSVSTVEKKLKAAGQRLTPSEACHIVAEAAKGLHYAHEVKGKDGLPLGLIHRDVSPQNLILAEDGAVKVVDFGLAKATNSGTSARTGGIKGKLPYMPPEQLRAQALDRRLDVFALGAVLWELATGTLLYPGKTEAEIFQQALFLPQPHPDEVARGLPRALVDVLLKVVERDVAKRTPTAEALVRAVAPLIQPDAPACLARRMREHFDPLPRSAGEALGLPPTPRAPPRGRPVLPRPPGRGRPEDEREPDSTLLDPTAGQEPVDHTVLDRQGVLDQTQLDLRPPSAVRARATTPDLAPPDHTVRQSLPDVAAEDTVRRPAPVAPAPRHPPAREPLRLEETQPGTSPSPITVHRSQQAPPTATTAVRRELIRRWAPGIAVALALPTIAIAATVVARAGLRVLSSAPRPAPATVEPALVPAPAQREPARPRGKGSLVLHSDVPAFVRANGRDLGMTPITVSFPAGPVKLQLSSPDGRRSALLEVTILAGEQVNRRVQLAP